MSFRREYRYNFGGNNNNPINSIWSIVILALVLVGLFILARFIFRILYFLSPFLLIATAIIDHKVIVNYVKWLGNMIRRNTLMGVGATVLSLVFFPVVSALLFSRALFKKQMRKAQQEQETRKIGEYVDFEEIVEDKPIKLKRLEKQEQPQTREEKKDDRYDQFFN
ncbi:MAG: hypothetical protein IPJ74_03605 [Saprospiraceae bacterium]|nr:hypothetical protein [Saprospiraceae bacterium]